jgi:hypothetical protein
MNIPEHTCGVSNWYLAIPTFRETRFLVNILTSNKASLFDLELRNRF